MLQEAEAAKEVAEQRFWLPLERSKGRRMGELCVSLLFTKVSCLCEEVKHTLMASCCSPILTVCLLFTTLQCRVKLVHITSSCGHQQKHPNADTHVSSCIYSDGCRALCNKTPASEVNATCG